MFGGVTEWPRSGLQTRVNQFDSGRRLVASRRVGRVRLIAPVLKTDVRMTYAPRVRIPGPPLLAMLLVGFQHQEAPA